MKPVVRNITLIGAIMLGFIVFNYQPQETTTAAGWLHHDCPQTEMQIFLNDVEIEYRVIAAHIDKLVVANSDTVASEVVLLLHEGHIIDTMQKPDCYDATQVVNVSYWAITAISEAFFAGAANDDDAITRATDEAAKGSNALGMIFEEYELSFDIE